MLLVDQPVEGMVDAVAVTDAMGVVRAADTADGRSTEAGAVEVLVEGEAQILDYRNGRCGNKRSRRRNVATRVEKSGAGGPGRAAMAGASTSATVTKLPLRIVFRQRAGPALLGRHRRAED